MLKPTGLKVLGETLDCGCRISCQTADDKWYTGSMIRYHCTNPTEEHSRYVEQKLIELKQKLP